MGQVKYDRATIEVNIVLYSEHEKCRSFLALFRADFLKYFCFPHTSVQNIQQRAIEFKSPANDDHIRLPASKRNVINMMMGIVLHVLFARSRIFNVIKNNFKYNGVLYV